MKELYEISQKFWSLFKSQNRYIYMESLILLYDEYLYNDYFLTKEVCIQLLSDYFSNRTIDISVEEEEGGMENSMEFSTESSMESPLQDSTENSAEYFSDYSESTASGIVSRLLRFTWLKKVEDYSSFKTNIIIPDYASVFIEAFKKIDDPDSNDTDVYIQNIYTNIYSFYHDGKAGIELLKTAMVNTTRLNRVLQDMLHNMDKFFGALLEKESYEALLQEHLTVYVEAMVNKKYAILKTNDNFYIYKNDIRKLLRLIQEDENRLWLLKNKMMAEGKQEEAAENEIMTIIDSMEQGMINIEKRISHIDSEHSKYVRATVSRLEYLLNGDDNLKGNVVKLLNLLGNESGSRKGERLRLQAAEAILLNDSTIITGESLYRKRGKRKLFEETVEVQEQREKELSKEDILKANRSKHRYGREQIEEFILSRMEGGVYRTREHSVTSQEEFELLILAYDYSLRKNSPFQAVQETQGSIINGEYRYPDLMFQKK